MNIFARLWRSAPAKEIPAPTISALISLRKGMWVVVRNTEHVGILSNFKATGECEFHLVNSKGETAEIRTVYAWDLRQATLMEIPAPRRPDARFGRALGYK